MTYKAVLFDLDGTLLDTLADLGDSMNGVLERFGLSGHSYEAYKYFVGAGMENLVRKALEASGGSEALSVETGLKEMRTEYAKRCNCKTRPYEGVPELLDALAARGVKMAILSNKADAFTQALTATLLAAWSFEVVAGERPTVKRKPDPQGAVEIAGLMGISPKEFLYLGDTAIDMLTANAAGMYAVGALWGFREADELLAAGAKTLIQHPLDLLKLL